MIHTQNLFRNIRKWEFKDDEDPLFYEDFEIIRYSVSTVIDTEPYPRTTHIDVETTTTVELEFEHPLSDSGTVELFKSFVICLEQDRWVTIDEARGIVYTEDDTEHLLECTQFSLDDPVNPEPGYSVNTDYSEETRVLKVYYH